MVKVTVCDRISTLKPFLTVFPWQSRLGQTGRWRQSQIRIRKANAVWSSSGKGVWVCGRDSDSSVMSHSKPTKRRGSFHSSYSIISH